MAASRWLKRQFSGYGRSRAELRWASPNIEWRPFQWRGEPIWVGIFRGCWPLSIDLSTDRSLSNLGLACFHNRLGSYPYYHRVVWASAMVRARSWWGASRGRGFHRPARESALAITDRKHQRKSFSYPGWIERGRGLDPIPCQIEDISQGGAKLAVGNVDSIPEQFDLRLSLTSQTSRPCIVKRRLRGSVGVQFIK